MRNKNILHGIEYSAIPTTSMVSLLNARLNPVAAHLPLVQVNIDFNNGKVMIEGDGRFLMSNGQQGDTSWSVHHTGRIRVDAEMFPLGDIDLNDHSNDGLVLPVQGIIDDGTSQNPCSGLLALEQTSRENHLPANNWNIRLQLNEYELYNCELLLKFPLYAISGNDDNVN